MMEQVEVRYTVYENSTPGGFVLTEGTMTLPNNGFYQQTIQSMYPNRGVHVSIVRYLDK
jgi:hypothetical protein